jgi:DNA polymerase III subunit epsilon
MDLLILDTETTGLDPTKDRLVEVATAIYSVEHRTIVKVRSWIVQGDGNEAESINGIPSELVRSHRHTCIPDLTDRWVLNWASEVDAIVAHNADFDQQWFGDGVRERPWVDSLDLEWPRASTSKSLTALALAHGVGVLSAHRALDDVLTLANLFARSSELGADVEAMVRRGLRPRAKFIADVSFDDRDKAKEAGFRWDGRAKVWTRTMAIDDTAQIPFAVRQVAA